MKMFRLLSLFVVLMSGCAGPMLNEYTEYLGPRVGSLEERQVMQNIVRFVDNPWAIPGHVELANGQIQAQNQLGFNLKYPFSQVTNLSSASATVTKAITNGRELDINTAQTQDQESYNVVPVTDADDLRRLRALYNFAICSDEPTFTREWRLVYELYFQPKPPQKPGTKTVKQVVEAIVTTYMQGKRTIEGALEDLSTKLDIEPPLATTPEVRNLIADILSDYVGRQFSDIEKIKAATYDILQQLGNRASVAQIKRRRAFVAGPPAPPKPGEKNDTKSAPGTDTVNIEENRRQMIIRELGRTRWLYIREANSSIVSACPTSRTPYAGNKSLVSLGVYGGREFLTDDPKKLSDLVLFVLGGIPNTTGIHVLDSGSPQGGQSKAGRQTTFTFQGQPGSFLPPKGN